MFIFYYEESLCSFRHYIVLTSLLYGKWRDSRFMPWETTISSVFMHTQSRFKLHKNLSSAPYITPCKVFQTLLWGWLWLVTKLYGVKVVGKASKISAYQWRISFGATWPLQGNWEKWITCYTDAIFCMGTPYSIWKYFWCRKKPAGEGRHGVCYATAALLKLNQQRQLLKYLLLSDERFCSVSQHSIWNLTHLSSLPRLLGDPSFKLSRFNSPALLHYRHVQQLTGDLCSFWHCTARKAAGKGTGSHSGSFISRKTICWVWSTGVLLAVWYSKQKGLCYVAICPGTG